ncbi:hypothetical protein [Nitratireductor soli]|uniref:hypothetical protein n=1 Tax=Nitratireductor soli TaxID=1670619 RepID=UPI000A6EA993|nr:hypothetical protein [Nitratireductor soli]
MRIGQHVVCIDDSPGLLMSARKLPQLERGRVYTLADVTSKFRVLAVQLEEYPRTYIENGVEFEGWLKASRFRPLRKLSIEDFTSVDAPLETELA